MNSYAFTQSLYTAPRERSNSRIAKTGVGELTVGRDNKCYQLIDEREYNKYHVLSDEQMAEELRRSSEVKQNILSVTGTNYGRKKTGIKVTAPMFGTASRNKKMASKNWQKDLQLAYHGGETVHAGKGSRERTVITQLLDNTDIPDDVDEIEEPEEYLFDKSAVSRSEGKITKVFNVIKQKYEQNLNIVEKLHREKMSLEEYARSLEEELLRTTGKLPDNLLQTRSHIEEDEHDLLFLDESNHGDRSDNPEYDSDIQTHTRIGRTRLSARDAAMEVSSSIVRSRSAGATVDRSLPPRHSTTWHTRSMSTSRPRSESRSTAASASTPVRRSRDRSASRRSLSSSGGHSKVLVNGQIIDNGTTTFHVSQQLQADIDNYVQKRRLVEERERLKKLEEEQYELQEKQRRIMAVKKGKDFSEMTLRQQIAKDQNAAKLKEIKDIERQKELEELQQKKMLRKKNDQCMAHAIHGTLSWKELEEQEEARRRDRIERRKQELTMLSNGTSAAGSTANLLTSSVGSSSNNRRQQQVEAHLLLEEEERRRRTFKAQDPEVVTMRLSKQQKVWETRLQREKQKLVKQHEEKVEKLRKSSSGNLLQSSMEFRADQQKHKREQRLNEQREREQREKEQKEDRERQRMQALVSSKLNENYDKKTKSVELREAKLRKEIQQQEAEERRRLKMMEKKKLALRDASVGLSIAMREREEELLSKGARKVELRASEEEARVRAKEATAEYNAKLKENEQKIQKSLENRPSLLLRQSTTVAQRDASANALRKLANVVMNTTRNKASDPLDDDFFNPKEKAVVSSMIKSGALYHDD